MRYMNELLRRLLMLVAFGFLLFASSAAEAQTTSFTYQGRLTDGGAPANNNYDLQFTLWNAAVGGTQQPQPAPATLTKTNVAVTGGVFSVSLDFGVNAFPGADRFLEVGVRPGGSGGAFTILAPRQQISSTPYALRTLNATAADSLSNACVGCVRDAQISSVAASKLTGTIPPSSLPAGGSFIQNTTALQANANFNISGNGIVGGNVGIGTQSPDHRLEVQTPLGSFGFVHSTPRNILLGVRSIKVGSFAGTDSSGAVGGWLGTLSNDPLHFFVNGGRPSMTINTDGHVGIGTTSTPSTLTVNGGNRGAVYAQSQDSTAMLAESRTGAALWGISFSSIGVNGQSNSYIAVSGVSQSSTGVYGASGSGFAMYADGNAGQRIDKGGWVKAMAFVRPNNTGAPTIVRCYNGTTGQSSNGCGFLAIGDFKSPRITIDFGFLVNDRFVTMTPVREGFPPIQTLISFIDNIVGSQVSVVNFRTCGSNCGEGQMAFIIVVY